MSGVTPWPASEQTFDIFAVLKCIPALETCRFADWRNEAVKIQGERCASAVYSKPGESWVIVGNLDDAAHEVRCVVHPEKLPCPLNSVRSATLLTAPGQPANAPTELDPEQVTRAGVTVTIPQDTAVVLHVR